MKKNAIIFIVFIFLPAFVLGVLAFRAAGQQKVIIENQEVELRQTQTDELAAQVRLYIASEFLKFKDGVNEFGSLANSGQLPEQIVTGLEQNSLFSEYQPVFFATDMQGGIVAPSQIAVDSDARLKSFFELNRTFFGNQTSVAVYQTVPQIDEVLKQNQMSTDKLQSKDNRSDAASGLAMESQKRDRISGDQMSASKVDNAPAPPTAAITPDVSLSSRNEEKESFKNKKAETYYRSVAPKKQVRLQDEENKQQTSSVVADYTRFSEIVSAQKEGIISRYVDDRLEVLFWYRPDHIKETVFCMALEAKGVEKMMAIGFPSSVLKGNQDVGIAILNNKGKPVSFSAMDGYRPDWKQPFVATEIGEVLPYWEVGLYFRDANRLERSARTMRLVLMSVIALALAAICVGVWFIFNETRKRMEIVQKKTDFVSNVSHELKTPLTSIRMFAELLLEGRVQEPEKVTNYLRIITLESERLTRLINNVLDFAKIEKGQKRYHKRVFDFYPVIQKLWEGQELHLRNQGFDTVWHGEQVAYLIDGDEDALSQVLVNLLSNAEKYSTDVKSIELHTVIDGKKLHVSVLDRGIGIPSGEEKKIFERFYRAHDSLSSGVQGSGLGLTLALKIAEDHRGIITYAQRKGGGSNFTLTLTLEEETLL